MLGCAWIHRLGSSRTRVRLGCPAGDAGRPSLEEALWRAEAAWMAPDPRAVLLFSFAR